MTFREKNPTSCSRFRFLMAPPGRLRGFQEKVSRFSSSLENTYWEYRRRGKAEKNRTHTPLLSGRQFRKRPKCDFEDKELSCLLSYFASACRNVNVHHRARAWTARWLRIQFQARVISSGSMNKTYAARTSHSNMGMFSEYSSQRW